MSNWIKCSEKKPRINQSVLGCRTGGRVGNFFYGKDEKWRQDGWGIKDCAVFDDITHWQPLPDAPGDEE